MVLKMEEENGVLLDNNNVESLYLNGVVKYGNLIEKRIDICIT